MSTVTLPTVLPRAVRLAELLHHRWAPLVLAALRAGKAGGRFAPLSRQLGVGRGVLKTTLAALEERRLVRKNPGYGHPLRPEYVPTARGRALGEWCQRLVREIGRGEVEEAALRKWSTPVLLAVHRGRHRFSEIQAALPGITARALALALKDLQEADLIERVVTDDYPPRVRYRVAPPGRRLARILDEVPRSAG